MPHRHVTLKWVVPVARAFMVVSLVLLALAFVVTCSVSLLMMLAEGGDVAAGVTYLVIGGLGEVAAALLVIVFYGLVRAKMASLSAVASSSNQLTRLQDTMQAMQDQLRGISDMSSLSDNAKAMIFHDREVDAVQELVNACILKQDYARAESLIDRMAQQGGYDQEVQRLREAVTDSRQASHEGKIASALQRVSDTIHQGNWERATREIQRLEQALPDNKQVSELRTQLADAKNARKAKLLQMYDQAVQRKDLDKSIELLRELDEYLSSPEAAALKESARGVFRAKLHSLGVSFSLAVTEQRWAQAVSIGTRIIDGYPNSRMAEEVRQKMDTLKNLADSAE